MPARSSKATVAAGTTPEPRSRVVRTAVHVDAWSEAVGRLDGVKPGPQRAKALLDFIADVGPSLPELGEQTAEILALTQAILAAPAFQEAMVGDPLVVTDVVDLPMMTAEHVAHEAVVVAGAHTRVLQADTLLTAAAVSELLGSRSANPRQYANRLRAAGDLVALPQRGRFLYPAFQIDAERHAVREPVAEVNRVLGAADDAWGVASWWLLPSATLGGTPASELDREGGVDRVRTLAFDVALGT